MNEYLRARYGDPCHGCGYAWSMDEETCKAIIDDAPDQIESLLAGRIGSDRHPDLEWNISAYVTHIADNLRIWAERVAAAALGSTAPVTGYDEYSLAQVRGYEHLPLQGAVWSLYRAVGDWQAAERLAAAAGTPVLDHPEQGHLGIAEVRRILAHEIHHHTTDLQRIVSMANPKWPPTEAEGVNPTTTTPNPFPMGGPTTPQFG